jgi:hypothetical protein
MGAPADEAAAAPHQKSGICKEGTRVTLHCQAFAWDGASNCMRRYAGTSRGSTPLSFTVGAGHVPAGQSVSTELAMCCFVSAAAATATAAVDSGHCALSDAGLPRCYSSNVQHWCF